MWPNDEEHLLCELIQSPDFFEQLERIKAHKATLPAAKVGFFPRSVISLLQNWCKTLDNIQSDPSANNLAISAAEWKRLESL